MAAYKGKILAAVGVGTEMQDRNLSADWQKQHYNFGSKNPFLMFIGPSGNVCRGPTPSSIYVQATGVPQSTVGWKPSPSGRYFTTKLLVGSNCLAWGGNELMMAVNIQGRAAASVYGKHEGKVHYWAFCPYVLEKLEQPFHRIVSSANKNNPIKGAEHEVSFSYNDNAYHPPKSVIQNGNYKMIAKSMKGEESSPGVSAIKVVGDKICVSEISIGRSTNKNSLWSYYVPGTQHKYWTIEELFDVHMASATPASGYVGLMRGYGQGGSSAGQNGYNFTYAAHGGGGGHPGTLGTMDMTNQTVTTTNLQCELIEFQGRLYIVSSTRIGVNYPGVVCGNGFQNILFDLCQDKKVPRYVSQGIDRYMALTPYVGEHVVFGNNYKCPIRYKDRLLFLQNNGILLEQVEGKIIQVADIKTQLSAQTTLASGIYGGGLELTVGEGENLSAYKCYGAELNGTLHVFLNYYNGGLSDNGEAEAGTLWATASGDLSFTHRALPNSGIIPPSGMTKAAYLSSISPFKFSGYQNFTAVDNVVGGIGQPSGSASQCRPSGWIQRDGITTEWHGSGTFIDCDYSLSPSQWDVPMDYNNVDQFLAPTLTVEPSGFTSGLQPSGIASSGYYWGGVCNYHIFGYPDQIENKLHLFFTEDIMHNNRRNGESDDIIASGAPNQTLYYTLNGNTNEMIFMNQFCSKRLSWIEPMDMTEPSVLLSSGTISQPYPYEDRVAQVVYQPFTIYDYPFFRTVDVDVQYSNDNCLTWNDATPHSALSCGKTGLNTGSITVDPSGTIGSGYMFAWDYYADGLDDTNIKHDWIQLRVRAKEND